MFNMSCAILVSSGSPTCGDTTNQPYGRNDNIPIDTTSTSTPTPTMSLPFMSSINLLALERLTNGHI